MTNDERPSIEDLIEQATAMHDDLALYTRSYAQRGQEAIASLKGGASDLEYLHQQFAAVQANQDELVMMVARMGAFNIKVVGALIALSAGDGLRP